MHVAIVSPYDPRPSREDDPAALRGGVEESLDRLASGLVARGHTVTVVCSAEREATETGADGVRFVRVKRRGALFRNPLAPLWRHVPDDADLVHVPGTYPFFSDYIPWREARRGRACVLDYHFDVHGTSLAMRAASVAHAKTLGRLMHRATRVVTKSLDYAAHSRALSKLPAGRLDWVPNAVDVDEFLLKHGYGEDILCVGRLVPYKGVDTLIEAMPQVHKQTRAKLVVAGDGPERAHLEALADELGAPVEFLGRVPRDRLLELYAEARLTVLPSANSQEAFGITLLESLASGTPVVASDLPGVREVAKLGGLTAPAREPAALADAITRAYREPLAFGTPEQLRERVRAEYAWPVVVARMERVYEQAILDARAKRPAGHATRRGTPGGSV